MRGLRSLWQRWRPCDPPERKSWLTRPARVIGAGLWISAILALEQLGLDPRRDGITMVPIGSPIQILRALEEGTIDAALVSVKQSHELEDKGFSVLLKDSQPTSAASEAGWWLPRAICWPIRMSSRMW